jgi:hypothetical protein
VFKSYRDIELHAEKVASQTLINEQALEYEAAAIFDIATRDLILRLHRYVYCSDNTSVILPYPESAWQHIKLQYAPKWFVQKYPVKFKKFEIVVNETFPHLSFLSNNKARYLQIRTYDTHCPK